MSREDDIMDIGVTAQGRMELISHINGGVLTQRKAIYAKCYECMGYYCDGKVDCKMPDCPLYPFMPYRESKKLEPKKPIPVGFRKRLLRS
jgi:hypothetical protein